MCLSYCSSIRPPAITQTCALTPERMHACAHVRAQIRASSGTHACSQACAHAHTHSFFYYIFYISVYGVFSSWRPAL